MKQEQPQEHSEAVYSLILTAKRMDGETFEMYKERRTYANKMLKKYLKK